MSSLFLTGIAVSSVLQTNPLSSLKIAFKEVVSWAINSSFNESINTVGLTLANMFLVLVGANQDRKWLGGDIQSLAWRLQREDEII